MFSAWSALCAMCRILDIVNTLPCHYGRYEHASRDHTVEHEALPAQRWSYNRQRHEQRVLVHGPYIYNVTITSCALRTSSEQPWINPVSRKHVRECISCASAYGFCLMWMIQTFFATTQDRYRDSTVRGNNKLSPSSDLRSVQLRHRHSTCLNIILCMHVMTDMFSFKISKCMILKHKARRCYVCSNDFILSTEYSMQN